MLRYVAFVWNPSDPQRNDSVRQFSNILEKSPAGWHVALGLEGLLVYCVGARAPFDTPHLLSNGEGVVLGNVFSRGPFSTDSSCVAEFSDIQSARIQHSLGSELVREYWGRYVCFLKNSRGKEVAVLRDPTGIIRCFETLIKGIRVFFSHVEDCIPLGLQPKINLDYVAALLQTKYAPECRETALENVATLLGGERVVIDNDRTEHSFLWDPRTIATTNVFRDLDSAVRELRDAVRMCVHAWTACHDSILHQLSGGLDSSILVTCLQSAPTQPRVTCLNLHSRGSDGDERRFARAAAVKANFPLIERERDPSVNLAGMLTLPRSVNPRPSSWMYYLFFGRTALSLARECGATVVFTGEYGDQIFYQGPAMLASVDCAKDRGISAELLSCALDVARLAGPSIWQVLKTGIWHGLVTRHEGLQWAQQLSEQKPLPFELSRYQVDSARMQSFVHPWLVSTHGVSIGKFEHLSQMAFNTFTLENSIQELGGLDHISPLFSQPLIETSLRIPIYLHLRGGWDRSVARRAFAQDLPREITIRRTKGGREEHAKETLFRNIKFARDLLLDGWLVRNGILDRLSLERTLSGESSGPRSTMADIYFCLGTEAWTRVWHGESLQQAA